MLHCSTSPRGQTKDQVQILIHLSAHRRGLPSMWEIDKTREGGRSLYKLNHLLSLLYRWRSKKQFSIWQYHPTILLKWNSSPELVLIHEHQKSCGLWWARALWCFICSKKKSVSRWTKCSCADETHTPREIQCGLLCINKFQIECLGKINKNLWWEDNYKNHLCLSLLSITGVKMRGMLSPEHDFFHSQLCSTLMMLLVRKKINFKQ